MSQRIGSNFFSCHFTQAVAQKCSEKQMFLKVLQKSQGNICVGVSFLEMLQAKGFRLYSKKISKQVFSYKFYNIFKSTTLIEILRETVPGFRSQKLYCTQANDLIRQYLIRLLS